MIINYSLIKAKIQPPQTSAQTIERHRLISMFGRNNGKKISIVTAPAGYGKTILMVQYYYREECPVAWYQLDEYDNDPVVFFQYLIASIAKQFNGFGDAIFINSLGKTSNPEKQIRDSLTVLLDRMERYVNSELIIILEDFHLINEPVILRFVEQLAQYLPKEIHLVITSRFYPPLNLSRLKASGMVAEIRKEHLRFNKSEINQILNIESRGSISSNEIEVIEKVIEGWAIGLGYAKLLFKYQSPGILVKGGKIHWNTSELYSYFATEIFDSQPEEIKEFLMVTSVLDCVTPEACDAILDRKDSGKVLTGLERGNSLITRIGGGEETYRYHHLFRDFLQTRLGERKVGLLAKAGRYYFENNLPDQAIEYFISADEYESAQKVIELKGLEALRSGRVHTVERWLAYAWGKDSVGSPWLMFVKGALLSYRGFFEDAGKWIDGAIELFKTVNDDEGIFQAQFYKSRVFLYIASYDESLRLLDEIAPRIKDITLDRWYDYIIQRAYTLMHLGKFGEVAEILQEAIFIAQKNNHRKLEEQFLRYMAGIYCVTGCYTDAISYYEKSMLLSPGDSAFNETLSVDLHMALLYSSQGETEKALRLIEQVVYNKKSRGFTEEVYMAYYYRARVFMQIGGLQKAIEQIELSEKMFTMGGGNTAFFAMIRTLKALITAEMGNLHEAKKIVEEVLPLFEGKTYFTTTVSKLHAARTYVILNDMARGKELAEQAFVLAEKIGMKNVSALSQGLLAVIFREAGDIEKAVKAASYFLKQSARENYIQIFISNSEYISLLNIGIEYNIEREFVWGILEKIGKGAAGQLLDFVRNSDSVIRTRAFEILQQIEEFDSLKEVEIMLYHENTEVKNYAQSMLQSLKQKDKASVGEHLGTKYFPRIFVCCFGSFQVFSTDRPNLIVEWRTSKAKELFAYLIHYRDRFISKEIIVGDIWPEMEEDQASALFHTNISFMKAMLKSHGLISAVLSTQEGYMLDLSNISCDIVPFEQITGSIKYIAGQEDLRKMEQAVSLYRGGYMQRLGWDWPELETAREDFRGRYLRALELIIEFCTERNENKKAEQYLKQFLREEPFSEEMSLSLMKIYARLGEWGAVKAEYQRLYKVLTEEIGIKPGFTFRKVYEELIQEGR